MFRSELNKFFQLVPKGKILEIGSGSGLDAKNFIKKYGARNYIGIDASTELLAIAKKTNPDGNFRLMNFYSLAFPDLYFEGIWICATHLVLAVLLAITIIGLPFAKQHAKLATLALMPFGRELG